MATWRIGCDLRSVFAITGGLTARQAIDAASTASFIMAGSPGERWMTGGAVVDRAAIRSAGLAVPSEPAVSLIEPAYHRRARGSSRSRRYRCREDFWAAWTRKRVLEGRRVSVSVVLGCRSFLHKKKNKK